MNPWGIGTFMYNWLIRLRRHFAQMREPTRFAIAKDANWLLYREVLERSKSDRGGSLSEDGRDIDAEQLNAADNHDRDERCDQPVLESGDRRFTSGDLVGYAEAWHPPDRSRLH
jgi:hypothetical protein